MKREFCKTGRTASSIPKPKMWIEIADDVQTLDVQHDLAASAALESVLSSAFRGEHVVVATRPTIEYLLKQGLTRASEAVLRHVAVKLPELRALKQAQTFVVELSANSPANKRTSPFTWRIPLKHFSTVALVPSALLGENLRDARIFELCGQHYMLSSKLRGIGICLTTEGAGGPEVVPSLKKKSSDQRQFVLALTDTDKSHPAGSTCAPTRKCQSYAIACTWVIHHIGLECRELENALPQNLLVDSTHEIGGATLSAQIAHLEQYAFENDAVWRWADMKLGTSYFLAKEENSDEAERMHWAEADMTVKPYLCSDACEAEYCRYAELDKCECLLLPGLGDKVLDRFLAHSDSTSLHKQSERVGTSPNRSYWLELGMKVSHWGVAFNKFRA